MHKKPRRWHAEEIALMEKVAGRARRAIERKTAERQLRRLNAALQAHIDVQASKLRQLEDALHQSQKVEVTGHFVLGLVHDINNVLGGVIGSLEMARRHAGDPNRVRRSADAGLHAAEQGTRLAKQLLAFSRPETVQLQPFDVCQVVAKLRELLVQTLGPDIVLNIELETAPIHVLADLGQIEMIVLNLALNSRDAMPNGGSLRVATRSVHIDHSPDETAGDYVEISVSDTGTGMDAETLRRAMEPFFTTKPLSKGTGLGLAQINESVRRLGGMVSLKSAMGIGTTVRVLLPRAGHLPSARAVKPIPGPMPPSASGNEPVFQDRFSSTVRSDD